MFSIKNSGLITLKPEDSDFSKVPKNPNYSRSNTSFFFDAVDSIKNHYFNRFSLSKKNKYQYRII